MLTKMPRVNIKPHGIALNSVQSTVAQGLLHSKLNVLEWRLRRALSALAWPFTQPPPWRGATLRPDHFGVLQKEDPEQILSSQCSLHRCFFLFGFCLVLFGLACFALLFSPSLPATSFLGLPSEIAVLHVAYPQKQVDGLQMVLHYI